MAEEEKNLIDLEVTSFMTACAAGVDTLRALLQRERLRRMEQEQAAARARGEDGMLDDAGAGGGGGELRPGSRPAHENATVIFLFERLKAVTEVAEIMQTERHMRAAAGSARFYAGPAESRRAAGGDGVSKKRYGAATIANVWKATPEELEEERLLQESLPAAYGDSPACLDLFAEDDVTGGSGGGLAGFAAATDSVVSQVEQTSPPPLTPSAVAAISPLPLAVEPLKTAAENAVSPAAGAGAPQKRPAAADERRRREAGKRPGVLSEKASAARRRWAGQPASGELGEGSGDGVMSAAVLEGENRDLVARLKNELDDARLVETKMSEISGLMGLFASKVVEQQGGMEHVFDAAVSANDKLVRGGQHLEKAVQRGGSFRLFYAWFMMGASFCLLFLHFYNP